MAKTATQPYRIIKTEKDFEIRLYPPATMATISIEAKAYKELSSPDLENWLPIFMEALLISIQID